MYTQLIKIILPQNKYIHSIYPTNIRINQGVSITNSQIILSHKYKRPNGSFDSSIWSYSNIPL